MVNWIISESIITLLAFFCGVFLQSAAGWKMGFPFTPEDGLKISFLVFAPSIWSILSILSSLGLLAFSISVPIEMYFFSFGLSLAFLLYQFISIQIHQNRSNLVRKKEEHAYQEIESWLKELPLDKKDIIGRQVYYLTDQQKITGHVRIKIPHHQIEFYQEKAKKLPHGISFDYFSYAPMEWEGFQKIRNWLKNDLSYINQKNIKDKVYWNEQQGFLGTIEIVSYPKDFKKIQETTKNLPSGIEIKLVSSEEKVENLFFKNS